MNPRHDLDRWFHPLEPRTFFSAVRFAVIGDFGEAGQAEADVAARVKSWMPDLIVTTGDNSYPAGTAGSYEPNVGQYYARYIGNYSGAYGPGSATNRFFPTLGNHDWDGAVAGMPTPYTSYFTLPGNERYYDFVSGPVHFFALDSDSREPDGNTAGSVQGQWLQAALAASTSPWNVVILHHAPYSSSSNHGSNTTLQWPYKAWGADVVLAGHDHTYERIINPSDGLTYFVNGIGGNTGIYGFNATPVSGSKVRYNAGFGAMLVDATDTQINFLAISRTGEMIDSYSLNTAGSGPVAPTAATATVVSYRQVNLTWTDNSSTETGFEIERSTGGGAFTNIATVSAGVTAYRDVSVAGNTTYQYRVRAVNQAGASTYSTSSSVATPAAPVPTTYIPFGATWKYRDDGSNQGTSWRALGFNDSAWASGAAELGYGDGGEQTVLPSGTNATKYITTYFRKSFNVANAAAVSGLRFSYVRDDGIVVYLNGVEVLRQNMPSGTISYTTTASSAVSGSDESAVYTAQVSPAGLLSGSNVVAVEIHQSSSSSSDLSFNLELKEVVGVTPPATFTASTVSDTQINLAWAAVSGVSSYKVEQSSDGITFSQIANPLAGNTTLPVTGLAPSGVYFFRVRGVDGTGDSTVVSASASTLPATPGMPDLRAADDSGSSSTDNLTRIATPTFIGTAPDGSMVKIFSDGNLVGSGLASGGNYAVAVSALTDGVRAIRATITDTHGNTSPVSAPLAITLDRSGPKVNAITFNGATARTNIHRIGIAFNEAVAPLASNLSLHNDTTGSDVTQTSLSYDGNTRTATWTFPSLARQMLPDGNYTATLLSGLTDVAGNGLDGDGNGTAGDARVFTFFQLAGDADANRLVDNADFAILYANFGLLSPDLRADFTDDGKVDFKDYQILEFSLNHSLPVPAFPIAPEEPVLAPLVTSESTAVTSEPVTTSSKHRNKPIPKPKPRFSVKRFR